MGAETSRTNLDIGHLFEKPMEKPKSSALLKLTLHVPEFDKPAVYIFGTNDQGKPYVGNAAENAKCDSSFKLVEFTPKSHLRDFEVLIDSNPFIPNIKIGRDKGICVVIVEALGIYLKLYLLSTDPSKPQNERIGIAELADWKREMRHQDKLSSDLAMGYDVLFLKGPDMERLELCEKSDRRDAVENTGFLPGFQQLGAKKRTKPASDPPPVSKKAKRDESNQSSASIQ